MNTANWIPDLFMKRVVEKGDWTLFSPSDVPELHDLFGQAFEKAYTAYEAKAARGEIHHGDETRVIQPRWPDDPHHADHLSIAVAIGRRDDRRSG